jgi:hypothetical protein
MIAAKGVLDKGALKPLAVWRFDFCVKLQYNMKDNK